MTASAPLSNGAAVNLNGDSVNVGSPLTLDDSDFFADAPFFLSPGDSDTLDLFTVSVSAGTTPGNYSGFFTVLGGATGSSSDVLGTMEFTTAVTPGTEQLPAIGYRSSRNVNHIQKKALR